MGSLTGRHVLVVEDDPDSRNVLRLTLEASGASVGTAASASEALAALVARPFEVVVSDLAMPEQSGFWLIAKIAPFSIIKEIEHDHNTALAVLVASVIIGLAMIVSAAIIG